MGKNMTKTFKLGVEFDEKTADMRDVRTLAVFEEGKLVTVEKAKNAKHKSAKSTHELVGNDEIVLKMCRGSHFHSQVQASGVEVLVKVPNRLLKARKTWNLSFLGVWLLCNLPHIGVNVFFLSKIQCPQ